MFIHVYPDGHVLLMATPLLSSVGYRIENTWYLKESRTINISLLELNDQTQLVIARASVGYDMVDNNEAPSVKLAILSSRIQQMRMEYLFYSKFPQNTENTKVKIKTLQKFRVHLPYLKTRDYDLLTSFSLE